MPTLQFDGVFHGRACIADYGWQMLALASVYIGQLWDHTPGNVVKARLGTPGWLSVCVRLSWIFVRNKPQSWL